MINSLRKPVYSLGIFVVTALFVVAVSYAVKAPQEQAEQGQWVGHTREVVDQLDRLALHTAQAENTQRGFLLTGDVGYLDSYAASFTQANNDIATIENLTSDNPHQQVRIPALRDHLNAKQAELDQAIDAYKKIVPEAPKNTSPSESENNSTLLHDDIGAMLAEEQHLLSMRLDKWHHAALRSRFLFVIGGLLMYGLLAAIFFALYKEIRQRRKLAEAEHKIGEIQRAEALRLGKIVAIQRDISIHHMDLQKAMNAITHHTQDLTRAAGSIIEMLDGHETVYTAASGTGEPHLGLRINILSSLSGRSIAENKSQICDDAESDDRVDQAACRKVGLRSMVVVPLHHNNQAVGVLKVLSPNVNNFNDEDVAALELMAGVLSSVISDASAAEIIRKANQQLERNNDYLISQKVELQKANSELEKLATTDGLTGLKNHRTFQESLSLEYRRAKRHKKPLSIVLLDVDHFKQFNDSFGHPAGDAVLRQVGDLIAKLARANDCAARYGGEEFAVLLPETDNNGAQIMAERIRQTIAEAQWPNRKVTVSVGVTSFDDAITDSSTLIKQADLALYQSKSNGRNCVSIYENTTPHQATASGN